jgi:hypothetical protein
MKPMWINETNQSHMTLPNIRRSGDIVTGYATAGSFLGSPPSVPHQQAIPDSMRKRQAKNNIFTAMNLSNQNIRLAIDEPL